LFHGQQEQQEVSEIMSHIIMRSAVGLLVVVSLGLGLPGNGLAAQPVQPAAPTVEIASYAIPGLSAGSLVKSLVGALSDKPGIVSAKADKKKARFRVTFEPGKTNPQEILKLIVVVAKEAKFEAVTAADGAVRAGGHDCSKCPLSKTCGKSQ
jgi:hypothetical protein